MLREEKAVGEGGRDHYVCGGLGGEEDGEV